MVSVPAPAIREALGRPTMAAAPAISTAPAPPVVALPVLTHALPTIAPIRRMVAMHAVLGRMGTLHPLVPLRALHVSPPRAVPHVPFPNLALPILPLRAFLHVTRPLIALLHGVPVLPIGPRGSLGPLLVLRLLPNGSILLPIRARHLCTMLYPLDAGVLLRRSRRRHGGPENHRDQGRGHCQRDSVSHLLSPF